MREGAYTLGVGPVQLHHGKGDVTTPDGERMWAVELSRVKAWSSNPRFLLVTLNAIHIGGSGGWDSVFVYACEQGRYKPVFSSDQTLGARVEIGRRRDFWLTVAVRKPEDAMCCPSGEERTHYVWDKTSERFTALKASKSTKRK